MTVTVKHSKTNAISDWTQAQLDEQISLGNFPAGTTLANIVLPSDWNNDHTLTGVGTMAEQNANSVAITGGSVNGTTIGGTTANTGRFTNVSYTSQGSVPTIPANGFTMYANNTNALSWVGANGYTRTFDGTSNTANRTYTLPDASGTLALTSNLGTIASQNSNAVAITGGAIDGTAIGATTASTGKFTSVTTPSVTATTDNLTLSAISTGKINLNTATANQVQITDATAANGQYTLLSRDNTANEQRISGAATSGGVNFGISSAVAGAVKFYTNGFTELQAQVARTASAVNYVQVTGSATGASASALGGLSFTGSDTNPNFAITTKGTGYIAFCGSGATNNQSFRISNAYVANTGNLFQVQSVGAGFAPSLSVISGTSGTDANISMAFQPKGTGAIDLAAGSSGVNISNGGTVTAVTLTNAGTGYTSFPTATIAVPTTAGGVQGVVSFPRMYPSGGSITSGGTGYTVGDVLTLVGGTPVTTAATLTVSTVSAGVITGYTISAANSYTVLPSSPTTVTGGTGSGATFTLTYSLGATTTISNAGSGYIEQPTVTFSGGGGSGAAAYATVGSGTVVKSLGATTSFFGPNTVGESFRIQDYPQSTSTGYWTVYGPNANPQLRAVGSGGGIIGTNSATPITFQTNQSSTGTNQFVIAHTASAVNYVQVTGGATGNGPTISTQGSDTNAFLAITSKGTSAIRLQTGGSSQVLINNTTSAINQLGLTGSTTGQACSIITQGTDTNIDLALTPKGTGRIKFGTYTATISAITGYIEILDSGGTLRRLAVVA